MVSADEIEHWLSPARFESYVRASTGDRATAVQLYEWNGALSAACFQAFQYVEVIVRNAIDRELSSHFSEATRLIPWYLLHLPGDKKGHVESHVTAVRARLRAQHPDRDARHQIIAGFDFGFWAGLVHKDYEQLWRESISSAFPHSTRDRADVAAALDALRLFRNKLAHHDSLLAEDVRLRLQQMSEVVGWVDPAAQDWLDSTQRISAVLTERPSIEEFVLVVPGQDAWSLYEAVHAYVCPPRRSFRPASHMAFYADQQIKREVPKVLYRRDNVGWTDASARRLAASQRPADQHLARVITISRAHGWQDGRYQVFGLSEPGGVDHMSLPVEIPHLRRGRGSAFTRRHRYVTADALRAATTTDDLG